MKRFHWTRKRYQRAAHLSRLLPNFFGEQCGQSEKPELVRRYHELWQRYPERGDPLRTPIHLRYDPEIPF